MERTVALLAAGYILYIPANALPVLTTIRFGREEHNTIMSGVLEEKTTRVAEVVMSSVPTDTLLALSWQ